MYEKLKETVLLILPLRQLKKKKQIVSTKKTKKENKGSRHQRTDILPAIRILQSFQHNCFFPLSRNSLVFFGCLCQFLKDESPCLFVCSLTENGRHIMMHARPVHTCNSMLMLIHILARFTHKLLMLIKMTYVCLMSIREPASALRLS